MTAAEAKKLTTSGDTSKQQQALANAHATRPAVAPMSASLDLDMSPVVATCSDVISTTPSSDTDDESEAELAFDIKSCRVMARDKAEFYRGCITDCKLQGPTMARVSIHFTNSTKDLHGIGWTEDLDFGA